MTVFLTTLHIVVCVTLILIVLLQAGKGANMGAAFGVSARLFSFKRCRHFSGKIDSGGGDHFHAHLHHTDLHGVKKTVGFDG